MKKLSATIQFDKKPKIIILISLTLLVVLIIGGTYVYLKKDSWLANDLVAQGEKYLIAKQYDNAIESFNKAIKADVKEEKAYIHLADIYIIDSRPEEAVQILKKGLNATQSKIISAKLKSEQSKINTYGNTSGNRKSYSLIAQQGDWIYYSAYSKYIYKVKINGTDKERFNVGAVDLNVVGDWIYYMDLHSNHICKIRLDGTEKTKLNNDDCSDLNVVGNWIYYLNYVEKDSVCKIFRIRTDGTGREKICDDEAGSLNVEGDWIYYSDGYDTCIYKIKTDGTKKTKLSKDTAYNINVVANQIYYSNNNNDIYKINTDGTGKTKVSRNVGDHINVVGDWIYYDNFVNDMSGRNYLYKIKTNGTSRTELYDNYVLGIYSINDWIYLLFYDKSHKKCLYKMKPDGSQKQFFDFVGGPIYRDGKIVTYLG